jgi:nucleoside-diphosphate-sugar epimerase
MGNVIGPGCRGLIPYLVKHAVRNPEGRIPAAMRGAGRIVRDYVPIEHIVDAWLCAMRTKLRGGSVLTLNVGSGRGLSNSEVAEEVREALAERGYRLELQFENVLGEGEARRAVLDVEATTRQFGLPPPDAGAVRDSIRQAAMYWLARETAEGAGDACRQPTQSTKGVASPRAQGLRDTVDASEVPSDG